MKLITTFFMALLVLLPQPLMADETLPDFFEGLFIKHQDAFMHKEKAEYKIFCRKHDLMESNSANQRQFFPILFFHQMFTGSQCSNFVSGGVLKLPYVWHWTDPNPRHEITWTTDSCLLSKVKPPPQYSRYKTYADIDRRPALYLGDLFSEKPKYYHPEAGEFYSFGWCSEREMAFCALMHLMGYTCKIKQDGIHTWSEFWFDFVKKDGSYLHAVASVDNSIDTITWTVYAAEDFKKWRADLGGGTQIKWYNEVFQSPEEQKALGSIIVTNSNSRWIEERTAQWLRGSESGSL